MAATVWKALLDWTALFTDTLNFFIFAKVVTEVPCCGLGQNWTGQPLLSLACEIQEPALVLKPSTGTGPVLILGGAAHQCF